MDRRRIVIMGAAGRDFHNFLVRYRDDDSTEVVAFTATQIPGIDERAFPAALAGPSYPDGIPIEPEERLAALVAERDVDAVVFAYSDVSHVHVMHAASRALASGADFILLGPESTMVPARVPVVSVCAVRTGVGKSAITRRVHSLLAERGLTSVAIRHPMPYRDLTRMTVERYAAPPDLQGITLEEREEYEHLVDSGITVFAGVDYEAIVRAAESEADVIIWDGGNNDLPFVASDLEIVALDPHRAGHERLYHPGETNFLRADVLVVNKVETAPDADVARVLDSAAEHNPSATVVLARSAIDVPGGETLAGARVLVVEDGPTVTHGGMSFGAGLLAAERLGAKIVDPRPYAVGSLVDVFAENPHLERVLPAMGYSRQQLSDLEQTVSAAPVDAVVIGTPIDLGEVIAVPQPTVRVRYGIEPAGDPTLADVLTEWCRAEGLC